MAVYSIVVTAPATTATTTTLTGWAQYVAVTVPSGAANPVFVSTSGTAVTTGVDSISCPVGTTYLRNHAAAPQLTATVPGVFDPSAIAAQTHAGTPVSTVGTAAVAGVTISLVTSAGLQPIIG